MHSTLRILRTLTFLLFSSLAIGCVSGGADTSDSPNSNEQQENNHSDDNNSNNDGGGTGSTVITTIQGKV